MAPRGSCHTEQTAWTSFQCLLFRSLRGDSWTLHRPPLSLPVGLGPSSLSHAVLFSLLDCSLVNISQLVICLGMFSVSPPGMFVCCCSPGPEHSLAHSRCTTLFW